MIEESQQTAGPTMMFATVDYEGCCVKAETEKIDARPYTEGVNLQIYTPGPRDQTFTKGQSLHKSRVPG